MSRNPVLLHASDLAIFERGGVRTVHLVTADLASQFVNGTTEFDPGASLPLYSHNCEESVVILEGEAPFEVDGEVIEMEAGDTTCVPAGVVHRFFNRGTGPMRILWIYGMVTANRTIAATGETFPIGPAATGEGHHDSRKRDSGLTLNASWSSWRASAKTSVLRSALDRTG